MRSNNALSPLVLTRLSARVLRKKLFSNHLFTLSLIALVLGAPLAIRFIPRVLADTATPVSITGFEVAVTENFNTLVSSGTGTLAANTPTGWGFSETLTNANTIYTAGNGSSNAGDTYSFGATSNPERAFGGLQSGNLNPTIGASFTNNTGGTITSVDISYTGEQWRLGTLARVDRLDFQISTNATSLTTGTWTDVNTLDFTAPTTGPTVGLLDGNAAANRTAISGSIIGLSITNGATFFIRWTDFNATNADDGLAVDDFSLTAHGDPGDTAPFVTATSPTNGAIDVAPGSNISVTFSESVNANANSFSIECPTGSPQTFSLSSSPSTTFTLDPTADLPNSTICTVSVFANQITDEDTNDPPDNMDANFVFSFTTVAPVADFVVINEVDSDTPGTDAAEFVEIYDGGVGNTSLNGLVVVFFNGGLANDPSYAAFDLDGFTTDANGYFTLGNTAVPGRDLVFGGNLLQNGADAVAIYVGNATNFPNGTPPTTANLVDAIVYGTSDPDDPGLLVLLNAGQPQVDENSGGNGDTVSSGRCPNGTGGQRNTESYKQRAPTPDGANDCPPPPVFKTIPEIQGNGATSPFAGVDVITTGIVTAKKSNGFFLQTTDADAALEGDPATSQGIFIFTSVAPPVAVGDSVTVTGTAGEFFQLTQVSVQTSDISIASSGNPLPAPITLTTTILNPAGLPNQLERFEGMRMHADTVVSVAPTNNFGETFTVLDGVARPMREPGIEISFTVPPDPTSGMVDCCIPRWDENPERIMIDSDGLVGSSVVSVTSNVTLTNITGPLDFTFGDYKVLPETAPSVTTPNMSAVPVPTPVAGEFTIAGFNIENFNNDPTQRSKAALAIRDVLHLPDIIGTIEIFELSGLEALADEIEAISGVQYEARLIEADGAAGDADQDVGFLVKTPRVQIDSVTQEELAGCDGTAANCNTFTDPNTLQPALLNDRPPLTLRATIDPSGTNPVSVIVVVNHTRSFIDIEDLGAEGKRVREKRKAQAEFLAALLQELQTDNPNTPVMSIGDYNAYQFSDGFTDPVATIKGTPTADDEIVVDASPDLVSPDLMNLTDGLPADQRYSFIFEGTPQAIDHMILNTVAAAMFQRYAVARNNSDFPELPTSLFSGDATRPERCSDHDMPVAYFKVSADLSISKADSPDPVVTGSNVTYTIDVTNNGPNTAQAVVVSDNLPAETSFVSCNATGGGICGGTGNNRTVTFTSLAPGASATITLVASVDCAVDNNHIISNTASVDSDTDDPNSGNDSSAATTTASDPAPEISCPANISGVEPTCPSGAIVNYDAPVATDNCPVTPTLTAGLASGSVFPIGTTTVTYTVTDTNGQTDSCSFTVTVLSPQQVVQNLINSVAGLSSLSGNQKQGLTSKLEAALDALNSGKTKVACNKLNDFISQVQAFINNGSLTPADGQPLIDSAQRVRNTIGCTNVACT